MMRLVSRLRPFLRGYRHCGLFLTFTSLKFLSHHEFDVARRALVRVILSRYPGAGLVWRQELQKRGARHLHILLFGVPQVDWTFLVSVWAYATRQYEPTPICWILRIWSTRSLFSYLSKYMAKVDEETSLDTVPYQNTLQDGSLDFPGRFWGYCGSLPFDLLFVATLTFRQFVTLRRIFAHIWSRCKGGGAIRSFSVFSFAGVRLSLFLDLPLRVVG